MRMTKSWGVALAAAAALAAGALAGCGQQAGDPAEQVRAIEIYEVPPAQLQSVRGALGDVLGANDAGSVSSVDGKLVVMAPSATQASIAKAIENLAQPSTDNGTANNTPVRLRFWVLDGSTEAMPADPRLEPLQPALDVASRGLGLQGYTLVGSTEVLASPGKGFRAQANFIVEGIATLSGAGVALAVNIETMPDGGLWPGRVETNVVLAPGDILVLGSSARQDGGMRLVIAQAELAADGS